jgi:hypothetical protein
MSSFEQIMLGNSTTQALSIWSKITIQHADAYSSFGERPIEDCMRPKQVECFSIQQNYWISDSEGNFVLWAQNAVELAKLDSNAYFATYTFQIWTPTEVMVPALCEPQSYNRTVCRAPFYTDPVRFPQSFTLYSHISNEGQEHILHMSNNFGNIDWQIPSSISCPCFIATVRQTVPPWGYSPFELVIVGLDSMSMASFRNDTLGTIAPILVQSSNGEWHETYLSTLHCFLKYCSTPSASGESSFNLAWNSTTGEFHWSKGADDQGVYVSAISNRTILPPPIPNPVPETFLYIKFDAAIGYLTMYDEEHRGLGFSPQSNKWIKQIPNSSIAFDRSETLLTLNPKGDYELAITAGGNCAFHLFLSKATNVGGNPETRNIKGALNIGDIKHFHLNTDEMDVSASDTALQVALPDLFLILGVGLWFLAILTTLFIFHRRARRSD